MVAGNVNNTNTGFTTASSRASTKATNMAVKKLLMLIPGNKYANTKAFTAVMRTFATNFIINVFNNFEPQRHGDTK